MKIIYQSARTFTLFSYDCSHGLLLLRSGKTAEWPTRFDIVFRDVRAMQLRVNSCGITIAERETDFLRQFTSMPSDVMEPGHVVYSIGNDRWTGFVVAGVVKTAEDEGEFFEDGILNVSGVRRTG